MATPRKKRVRKTRNRQVSLSRKGKAKPKTNPSFPWTWDAGITQSMLTLFMKCREQTYLKYMKGYTARHMSTALEFGTIWHLCQEHQHDKAGESPASVARRCIRAYSNARKKTIFKTEHDAFDEICSIIQVMFPIYCKFWAEDDSQIDWIAPEQKFAVPYTFIDHKGESRTIILNGMRDRVYRENGLLGVFETKTRSRNTDGITDDLKADFQTSFYAVAAEVDLKERPEIVMYNVVRKPMIQKRVNESIKQYCDRVAEDATKRGKFYFQRWDVHLTATDLKRFRRRTLDPALRLFAQWVDSLKKSKDGAVIAEEDRWRSPFHILNSNELSGKYGKAETADLILSGRQSGYLRRKTIFPELEESTLAL